MKKFLCLAASLLALNLTPVFSQPTPAAPAPYPPGNMPQPPAGNFQQRLQTILRRPDGAPQTEAPEMTSFNLDFPGGTPKELVAAIEKAMGKPLNAIIPTEDADVQMPPLKMNDVVVPQLFAALSVASRRTITVPIGNMPPGNFAQQSISYGFNTADGTVTDTSVWYFHAEKPSPPTVPAPQRICQFYSLEPYLERGLTVDDITTAIQTGWKMSGDTSTPELNYHKETSLLIAFGEPAKLQTIDNVLRSLPTVGNQYWSQLSSHVSQLQWQVDELKKKVASPATNSVPEEKSGK